MAGMLVTPAPQVFQTLAERYDSAVFEPSSARLPCPLDRQRRRVVGCGARRRRRARPPAAGDADATLTADARTWRAIAEDVRAGMRAYLSGRLEIRRNLHLGVGFLAATSGHEDRRGYASARSRPARRGSRRWRREAALRSWRCTGSAGRRDRSCRPWRRWRAAIASSPRTYRGSAIPTSRWRRPMTPGYFAAVVVDLLDALDIERAHLIGNSLGGRVALEVGCAIPTAPDGWRSWRPRWRGSASALGAAAADRPAGARPDPVHAASGRRDDRAPADPRGRRRLGRGGRRRVPARLPHPCRQVRLLRGGTSHLSRGARRQQRLLAKAAGAASPMRCSSGDAATGSCRSPSRGMSPRRCRPPAISSSTAGTSRRSSGRGRRTRRSARSCGHERALEVLRRCGCRASQAQKCPTCAATREVMTVGRNRL